MTAEIEGWTAGRDKREVMKAFAGRGIVCGAVLDTAEVLADPHLRERETIFDLDHPTRGRFPVIGCPVRLSDSPVAARRAPLKGEHTAEVRVGEERHVVVAVPGDAPELPRRGEPPQLRVGLEQRDVAAALREAQGDG